MLGCSIGWLKHEKSLKKYNITYRRKSQRDKQESFEGNTKNILKSRVLPLYDKHFLYRNLPRSRNPDFAETFTTKLPIAASSDTLA